VNLKVTPDKAGQQAPSGTGASVRWGDASSAPVIFARRRSRGGLAQVLVPAGQALNEVLDAKNDQFGHAQSSELAPVAVRGDIEHSTIAADPLKRLPHAGSSAGGSRAATNYLQISHAG
jgi:hypothetical protein